MKLGEIVESENRLLGRRDAFHVACVLCEVDDDEEAVEQVKLVRGSSVRFTSAAFSEVRACRPGEAPHGFIDPFINVPVPMYGDYLVWVILVSGVASAPRHDFDISIEDPDSKSTWDCRDCN